MAFWGEFKKYDGSQQTESMGTLLAALIVDFERSVSSHVAHREDPETAHLFAYASPVQQALGNTLSVPANLDNRELSEFLTKGLLKHIKEAYPDEQIKIKRSAVTGDGSYEL